MYEIYAVINAVMLCCYRENCHDQKLKIIVKQNIHQLCLCRAKDKSTETQLVSVDKTNLYSGESEMLDSWQIIIKIEHYMWLTFEEVHFPL